VQRDRHRVEIVVEQIAVGVQFHLCGGMPEHPLQREHIHTRRDCQRGAFVPKIVRSGVLHLRLLTAA
jgi:hypothetical protein